MKRHLVFAIVLASAGQALGADFDIDAYCRKVSEAAADRPKAEATCRDREKGFKAKLDRTSVPSDVERDCLTAAQSVGGSYQVMNDCVQEKIADGLK